MKRIFKNKINSIITLVIIAVGIASFGIIVQSCNNDFNLAELKVPKEYDEVGKLHNEGLDYILENLKK